MNVLLLSSHLYHQPRKGGFHWLCDSLVMQGHQVSFLTVDFSLLTLLKGDRRTRHGRLDNLGRMRPVRPGLRTGVLFTATHPIGAADGIKGRLLNALTRHYPGVMAWPRIQSVAGNADLVIFESNASLCLAAAIRACSRARLVYRVSDDLRVIRPVPALLEAERRAVQVVDVVSVASPSLARQFGDARVLRIDPMGIDKRLFDREQASPYAADGRPRVVCSGSSGFDAQAFHDAASQTPDAQFVLVGEAPRIGLPNVLQLGEQPFEAMVPYVRHADLGFAPFRVRPGVEYQADHSNRLLQYTYCGLPSVVPRALTGGGRAHFFGYGPGDDGRIADAVQAGLRYDRTLVPRHSVLSWSELSQRLVAAAFPLLHAEAS